MSCQRLSSRPGFATLATGLAGSSSGAVQPDDETHASHHDNQQHHQKHGRTVLTDSGLIKGDGPLLS
jgi:hypothetical protein